MQSFVVNGTPKKGFSLARVSSGIVPDLMRSSIAWASFRASEYLSATTQFRIGFTSSIRSMKDSRTCTLVIWNEIKRNKKSKCVLTGCKLEWLVQWLCCREEDSKFNLSRMGTKVGGSVYIYVTRLICAYWQNCDKGDLLSIKIYEA